VLRACVAQGAGPPDDLVEQHSRRRATPLLFVGAIVGVELRPCAVDAHRVAHGDGVQLGEDRSEVLDRRSPPDIPP
jgi:hypothetical protein